MSAIRAMGGAATQATIYPASQAGYDAAIADLTASGGVIELSTGLEAINLGTIPSSIVVLRMRTTPSPSIEIAHDLVLSNYDAVHGSSNLRMSDSAGTLRTVLSALATDVLRIAYLSASGLTITDQNGNIKATVTASRIAPASGVDFAPNNLPGSSGQVLTSAGAAASPTWTTPAGLPGSTMAMMLTAPFWGNSISTATPGTGAYVYSVMSGATDNSNYADYIVPSNYASTTSWQMIWTQPSTDAGNCLHAFSMFKVGAAGFDFSTATFTAGATQTTAGPGASLLAVTTMPTPAVTLAAGDRVILRIRRIGTPDPPDTNTVATHFIGMQHNYT